MKALSLICPTCNGYCYLTTELMEYIIGMQIEYDAEDLADLDKLVQEAFDGEHKHNAKFKEPLAFFPVAIDEELGALVLMAWCPKCRKPKNIYLTPQELINLLKGEDNERSDSSSN